VKLKLKNVLFGALDDVCFRDKFGLAISTKVD